MIKQTEYWENQEGFDPDALRQAFHEQLEMWAEEYGLEKRENGDDAITEYVKKGEPVGAQIHDLGSAIVLQFPRQLIGDYFAAISYRIENEDQKPIFYFSDMHSRMGDAGLQKILEFRKQIEKRINEIELEQLEVD